MRELGQLLRDRRLKLGISLEEVQTKTKIRKRYLQALEDGDWDALPGEVYARGFVRSYAELLGLDGLALLQEHRPLKDPVEADDTVVPSSTVQVPSLPSSNQERPQNPSQRQSTAASQAPTRNEELPPRRRTQSSQSSVRRKERKNSSVSVGGAGQVAMVAGVLIVIGIGWYYLNQSGTKAHPNSPGQSTAAVSNNSFAATGGNAAVPTNGSTANVSDNNTGGNLSNTTGTSNTVGNNTTTPATTTTITANTFQNYTQSYVVHTTNPMDVQVTAGSGSCWVSVTSDGSVVDPSDTLQPGQSKSWSAAQTLQIHAGNVPAITVTVNGVPVNLPNVQVPIYIQFTKSSS